MAGWKVGDDIIVSSSHQGGQPENHTIAGITGRTLTLQYPLAKDKIGEVAMAAGHTVDMRATVSLLSRNIEVRGGTHFYYDWISSIGPFDTQYGATIMTYKSYEEDRPGWDETMVGYEVYGKVTIPAGFISNFRWLRMRYAGKSFDMYPHVTRAMVGGHADLAVLELEGVVVTEPLAGKLTTCFRSGSVKAGTSAECALQGTDFTVRDSIFWGVSVDFWPQTVKAHHVAERNLFFGGELCLIGCPSDKMVIFGNPRYEMGGLGTLYTWGTIHAVNNTAYGAYGAFTIRAPCYVFDPARGGAWENNVAMGNAVGFDVEAGCDSLPLIGYRNSAGINTALPQIGNFFMAENGVGVVAGAWNRFVAQAPNGWASRVALVEFTT